MKETKTNVIMDWLNGHPDATPEAVADHFKVDIGYAELYMEMWRQEGKKK